MPEVFECHQYYVSPGVDGVAMHTAAENRIRLFGDKKAIVHAHPAAVDDCNEGCVTYPR